MLTLAEVQAVHTRVQSGPIGGTPPEVEIFQAYFETSFLNALADLDSSGTFVILSGKLGQFLLDKDPLKTAFVKLNITPDKTSNPDYKLNQDLYNAGYIGDLDDVPVIVCPQCAITWQACCVSCSATPAGISGTNSTLLT